MSISKEVRTGLLVTISLVILFAGFYFLKGSDIFSQDYVYYCNYAKVDGLQNAAAVEIRGLAVGRVTAIELDEERGVKVTIVVSKKIAIPQGTVATLVQDGLLGGKVIRLDLGKGPSNAESKSTLVSAEEPGMVDDISNQVKPLITSLRATVNSLDTIVASVNIVLGENNRKGIQGAIASINKTADNIAELSSTLNAEAGEIKSIVHNANTFSATLAKNNDTISRIMANFSKTSDQLAQAPIKKTFDQLETASTQFSGIVNKINNGEGSLGQMVTNKDLYNNLNNLLSDLKSHPSRYINLTVFGGKKRKD